MGQHIAWLPGRQAARANPCIVTKDKIPDPCVKTRIPTRKRFRIRRKPCQERGCPRKAAEWPVGTRYCREHGQQAWLRGDASIETPLLLLLISAIKTGT